MVARKQKVKQSEEEFVKALLPKDIDVKYFGDEPIFPLQPLAESRSLALTKSFSWYNRFYTKKDGKDFLISYLEHNNRTNDAKQLAKANDNEFPTTLCWLGRMTMRGLQLSDLEKTTLENEIQRLIMSVNKPIQSNSITGKKAKTEEISRPNVQEIMREKAREAAGELEGMFDEYLKDGKSSIKVIDVVAKFNVLPQHIPIIVEAWKSKLVEFDQVSEGTDEDLVNAYKHLGKVRIKNTVKFIEQVLSDLNSYISIKKASKAPRKRKAIPVEKQVAKLKYLKEFKDKANGLDLVSVHPTKLHGASEAWVYDTEKRKLHHYVADEYSKTFTVKGNTLLGFDTNQSEIKTLRKPSQQIKEIMGSKPVARKFFKEIKSVSVTPNGRFNPNMIILRCF